jgi:hypothetical protein
LTYINLFVDGIQCRQATAPLLLHIRRTPAEAPPIMIYQSQEINRRILDADNAADVSGIIDGSIKAYRAKTHSQGIGVYIINLIVSLESLQQHDMSKENYRNVNSAIGILRGLQGKIQEPIF